MDLEDRAAILDLMADYWLTWDGQDPEAWARLFTPDGVFELYFPGVRPPVRRLTNLGERITSAREAFLIHESRRTRTFATNIRFDSLTADCASVRSFALVTELLDPALGDIWFLYTGLCLDEFRKTPVGWRFAKRELHSDQNPGFGDGQDFDSSADAPSD